MESTGKNTSTAPSYNQLEWHKTNFIKTAGNRFLIRWRTEVLWTFFFVIWDFHVLFFHRFFDFWSIFLEFFETFLVFRNFKSLKILRFSSIFLADFFSIRGNSIFWNLRFLEIFRFLFFLKFLLVDFFRYLHYDNVFQRSPFSRLSYYGNVIERAPSALSRYA